MPTTTVHTQAEFDAAWKKCRDDWRAEIVIDSPRGGQWLSDGCNAYPVDGVRIYPESIPGLFDLTEKQASSMQIREVTIGGNGAS